ncbi:MAG: hypothetical protein OEV37_01080 [Candidatus Berkelbacteria bacterium]|nr:hypothetical protein [Candidatus Berkelbacteria bacterium]
MVLEDQSAQVSPQVKETEEEIGSATKKAGSKEEAAAYFIIGLFLACIVSMIAVFALMKSKEAKISNLEEQIQNEVTGPLKELESEEKEVASVLGQIETLTSALTERVKYASLINDLKSNLYKKSLWGQFSFQKDTAAITGTVDSFEDLAKTVSVYKKMKGAQDVQLTGVSVNAETKKIDYSLTIKLDMSLYKINGAKPQATATASAQTNL